jgi:hypothetical protein
MSFVCVQVRLVDAVRVLIARREQQKEWRDNYNEQWWPAEESYALMEEFLFWIAALHR